ncbi:MAG: hypothetical protein QOF02_3340, partial [Blastocatellia bacterium]|nr:hypothetical protein [Blastocatellia bacterium]
MMNGTHVFMKALLLMMLFVAVASNAAAQQLAVRAETLHTMAGPEIKDGVVLIRDGKIEKVGPASQLKIPAGYKILTARVVTPGLIDAHTVVGLAGYLNQPQDQDQLERSAPLQPELRAVDAYNPRERLVEYLRSFGVTTIHTGHAPGALISGQTMIIKTQGDADDTRAVLNPSAMIASTLGASALAPQGKSPGTRSKMVAMLRAELLRAREYQAKQSGPEDKRPARDLHMEALGRALKGETPLLVTAQRAGDILSALRVAKEFNLRIVLDGAAESYLVIEQIKAANGLSFNEALA